jgi:hypothetical protein
LVALQIVMALRQTTLIHVRCWLSGKEHKLECPIGTIDAGNTVGCGILLNSMNEWAVFLTLNGILTGKLLVTSN